MMMLTMMMMMMMSRRSWLRQLLASTTSVREALFLGALSSSKGKNAARFFARYKGQMLCVFFVWLFVDFCPLFFQSSTFLSLRFVGVAPSEFFFRLRVVYCIDSARFFMGNPIGFASRKMFFGSSVCLTLIFSKFLRENFRERTSG